MVGCLQDKNSTVKEHGRGQWLIYDKQEERAGAKVENTTFLSIPLVTQFSNKVLLMGTSID